MRKLIRWPVEDRMLTGVILGYRVSLDRRSIVLRLVYPYAPHVQCAKVTGEPRFAAVRIL